MVGRVSEHGSLHEEPLFLPKYQFFSLLITFTIIKLEVNRPADRVNLAA
jgi:hypothetical protein